MGGGAGVGVEGYQEGLAGMGSQSGGVVAMGVTVGAGRSRKQRSWRMSSYSSDTWVGSVAATAFS